jgi:hypothetical protein
MKAEELADKIEDRSRFGCETEEQATKRHILACKAAAAELRRLAALEQAAEPVAWGHMRNGVIRDCIAPGEVGAEYNIPLYTHPAPRKPMTANEIWNADEIMSVNADAQISFVHIQRFVRAVERFHDIKE